MGCSCPSSGRGPSWAALQFPPPPRLPVSPLAGTDSGAQLLTQHVMTGRAVLGGVGGARPGPHPVISSQLPLSHRGGGEGGGIPLARKLAVPERRGGGGRC